MEIKISVITFIVLFSFLLTGCQSQTWTAFYYPDGVEVERTWQIMHGIKSKEECLDIAISAMSESTNRNADYKCGSYCRKIDPTMPEYICKETVQ